ncbi:hypothetical protein Vgi01_05770 [Micromonospora gifhornensis]|uniref:Secreted protein n=1 Tax=Micromonospora gifhornensis TaxID=84594 RepID=A0ABQ4I7T8_9ACTN|nr:hypothetical protein Vgi01_05770 [Micromonospora gifhornensis]
MANLRIAAIATTTAVASHDRLSNRVSTVASRRRTIAGTPLSVRSVEPVVADPASGCGWSALALCAVDALVTRRS